MFVLFRLARIFVPCAARAIAGRLLSQGPASLTCEADDRNLSFDLLGNIGSCDGDRIQLINGEIKLKAVRGKFNAREFKIAAKHLSGQWSFGKELRIGVSPESVDGVSVLRHWLLKSGRWLGRRWALHDTNIRERLGFFRRHLPLKLGGAQ